MFTKCKQYHWKGGAFGPTRPTHDSKKRHHRVRRSWNKPPEMSNKTGFRIPVLSTVHVTSHSSAVLRLASMVQEYGSTEGIMTGYSSKYYEKNLSYCHLVSHKSHTNSPVGLAASGEGVISIQTTWYILYENVFVYKATSTDTKQLEVNSCGM